MFGGVGFGGGSLGAAAGGGGGGAAPKASGGGGGGMLGGLLGGMGGGGGGGGTSGVRTDKGWRPSAFAQPTSVSPMGINPYTGGEPQQGNTNDFLSKLVAMMGQMGLMNVARPQGVTPIPLGSVPPGGQTPEPAAAPAAPNVDLANEAYLWT